MNKLEEFFNRNRKFLTLAFIVWLLLTILIVMPMAFSWYQATNQTADSVLASFFSEFSTNISKPLNNLANLGTYWNTFIDLLWKFCIIYAVAMLIGFLRQPARNEYTDIEHGSSDWCEHGEQYRVLNSKKGIILAEGNYLPVDKQGNVNILVVGRIWCW